MGSEKRAAKRLRFAALAAGVGGALLFLWSIRAAGTSAVRDGVGRVGWWLVVICLLGGIRYLLRAVAWRMCLDDPHRLPLSAAFGAAVMGVALGNVTPFGVLVSEPSKVAFVQRRVGAGAAISAVAIENLFYAASVVIVCVCGTAALLLSFDVGVALRRTAHVTLGVPGLCAGRRGGVDAACAARRRARGGVGVVATASACRR